MEKFDSRNKNKAVKHIVMWPIIDICLEAERRPGLLAPKRWWEHEGLDLVGLWEGGVWGAGRDCGVGL